MIDYLFPNQAQKVVFIMVDLTNTEVTGLGAALNVFISKNGSPIAPGTGAVAEIGMGWYSYTLSAAETDTPGPLVLSVTGAGCVQQNLEYTVQSAIENFVEFTYTIRDSLANPIADVDIWITADAAGTKRVWSGKSDVLGVARDTDGFLPLLNPGVYYFWSRKPGYRFNNPDTEIAG